jgi:hypothetical protein
MITGDSYIGSNRQHRLSDQVSANTVQFLPSILPEPSPAPPSEYATLFAGSRSRPQESEVTVRHLNQVELARRWNISARTLERWRWLGEGPVYLKLGGRVSYRLEDIEHYETTHLHANTTGPLQTDKAIG